MAKSKLPDVSEISKYAGKLFKDIKQSITGICQEYSEARKEEGKKEEKKEGAAEKAKPAPKQAGQQAHAKPDEEKPTMKKPEPPKQTDSKDK